MTDEPDTDGSNIDEPNTSESSTDLAERRGIETDVYQPAEDSALLASTAIEHAHGRTLEVGTGSGWVAQTVAEQTDAEVVASDLNPHACRQARERGLGRTLGTGVVRASLVEPFQDGAFDTVLFNPPYLPTEPENEWSDWMETALSGGESGRELIDPFLDSVGRVLASNGIVLLLVSSLTGFDEVVDRAERNGFSVDTLRQESYPFETLTILQLREE